MPARKPTKPEPLVCSLIEAKKSHDVTLKIRANSLFENEKSTDKLWPFKRVPLSSLKGDKGVCEVMVPGGPRLTSIGAAFRT